MIAKMGLAVMKRRMRMIMDWWGNPTLKLFPSFSSQLLTSRQVKKD